VERWQIYRWSSQPTIGREFFGVADYPTKQQTAINFEEYDDNIPVKAFGHNVLGPVLKFTNPPLDDHLLKNIELVHHRVPTPVQKYSIPVVMSRRDLMACVQLVPERLVVSCSPSFPKPLSMSFSCTIRAGGNFVRSNYTLERMGQMIEGCKDPWHSLLLSTKHPHPLERSRCSRMQRR
jgi:hypothetical protein